MWNVTTNLAVSLSDQKTSNSYNKLPLQAVLILDSLKYGGMFFLCFLYFDSRYT